MIIFYLITGAVLVALLYVFWLIWQEQNQDASDGPSAKPDKDEHISAAGILDRIGIKPTPPKKKEGLKKFFPHLGLKEKSNPEQSEPDPATAKLQDPPETGTASLRLDHKEQQSINTEVELSIKNDELQHALEDLQEKYQKVDQLLKEKNDTLEKSQKELEQERKNRKEFNKVKDLLEKELKEANDRTKKAQIDFSAFKAESQTYTNRINQLEEKIKTLEKSLNEKNALIKDNEEKINILNQKIAEAKPVVPAGEAISTQQPSSSETVAQPAESNKSIENEIVPAETTPIASATPQDKIPELPLEAASSSTKKSEEEEPFLSKENPTPSDNITKQSKKLDLNPVSNLEPHYDSEAAPQREKTEKKATSSVQEKAALTEPQETIDPVIESLEKPSTEFTSFAQDQAKAIDAFLNANTRDPKQLTEPPTEILIPKNDHTVPSSHNVPENVELLIPMDDPVDESTEKIMPLQEEAKPFLLKSTTKEEIHLAPDIFKDIEAQFRQIEQEMNITENEQNIDTEDPSQKTQDQNPETENPNSNN